MNKKYLEDQKHAIREYGFWDADRFMELVALEPLLRSACGALEVAGFMPDDVREWWEENKPNSKENGHGKIQVTKRRRKDTLTKAKVKR